MEKRSNIKLNIPMCAACVLLCLTLISIHFCSGLYARYVTQGSGGDSARVAVFDVTDDGGYFSVDFVVSCSPGVAAEKVIKVGNKSQVAVAYTVTITNTTGNIPFKFKVNDSEPTPNTCTVACDIGPGVTDATVTIAALWDVEGALEYMGMVDLITIEIRAQQID